MPNRLFALLVGVDRYANPEQMPPLRGCVADVEGSYALLTSRFAVPPAQIRLLTARLDQSEPDDARATRANLLHSWQEHLGQAGPGDLVFFHYSGYGSQARTIDPTGLGSFAPTLVPYDSRTAGIFDLTGQELASLIHRLEERGVQVMVLLDCCHTTASARRAAGEAGPAAVRCCPPDERLRPPESLAGAAPAAHTPRSPSGWLPLGRHVLLAACREGELAYEYQAPDSDGWRGATSYFFQQMLAASPPGVTWAQLHDALLAQIHAVYPHQTPQLEGPSHLTLFSELSNTIGRATAPYLRVLEVEGQEYVQVSGGAAVGLTPGSRLALYSPAGDLTSDLTGDLTGEPLAYGLVEEVRAGHAWAKLDRLVALPAGARAQVLTLGLADLAYRVHTEDLLMRQALLTGERSPFLRLEDRSEGESPASADFVVTSSRGVYTLFNGVGEPLVEAQPPVTPEGALDMLAMMEHLAIYRNVQRLHNPVAGSLQSGLLLEAAAFAQTGRAGYPLDPIPLYDDGHSAVIAAGHKVQLTIHNRTAEPVYLAVFALDDDYSIRRVYPAYVAYQMVQPEGSVLLEPFETPLAPGRTQARAILKVIAARTPMSFDVLQLPKLGQGDPRAGARAGDETPLGQLLNGLRRQGTRDFTLAVDHHAGEWATRQIELMVLGLPAGRPLPPGATQVELGDGWTVEKPAAFSAEWTLGSGPAASRALGDGASLRLPPGLDTPEAGEVFRPVQGRTTGAPVVVRLVSSAEQLASISAAQPLRVELPLEASADVAGEPVGVVPVAYDGELFYLAGRPVSAGAQRLACTVEFLPAGLPVAAPIERDAAARSLPRAVRLYFYKVFARALPSDAGLRRADLADGRAVFHPVEAADLAGAQRAALLIHGFLGDTRWMVERVWSWTRANGAYDLCLTFDYESFGVGIRRNAELLAAALKAVGIGPEDGLHLDIFAHGMGSQVARALIELLGGHSYVNRLFMGGPPNAGTPLASGRALLPWLGNLLVNLAGSASPALVAHWLLDRFTGTAHGLADLEPDSRFLQDLNAPWRAPADIPYFIQIGDNSRAYPQAGALARRLMGVLDSGLDTLFAGDNDLIVGVNSARSLESRWPRLEVALLGVNHFGYFYTEEGQRALARWLSQA